jgi:hypothetical protein
MTNTMVTSNQTFSNNDMIGQYDATTFMMSDNDNAQGRTRVKSMLFCSSNKQNSHNKHNRKNKPKKIKKGISKNDIVLNSNDLKFPLKKEEGVGIDESQVSIKSFSNNQHVHLNSTPQPAR